MYYRSAAAALIIYDITKKESFLGAQTWFKELERRGEQGMRIALAGNKADKAADRKVAYEEGKAYADANNMIFAETSALVSTGDDSNPHNIKKLFLELAQSLPRDVAPAVRSEAYPISMNKKKTSCC